MCCRLQIPGLRGEWQRHGGGRFHGLGCRRATTSELVFGFGKRTNAAHHVFWFFWQQSGAASTSSAVYVLLDELHLYARSLDVRRDKALRLKAWARITVVRASAMMKWLVGSGVVTLGKPPTAFAVRSTTPRYPFLSTPCPCFKIWPFPKPLELYACYVPPLLRFPPSVRGPWFMPDPGSPVRGHSTLRLGAHNMASPQAYRRISPAWPGTDRVPGTL